MDFATLASDASVSKTVAALTAKNYDVTVVDTGAVALEKIKTIIPPSASVMNGASVTLETIGFVDYLKSGAATHSWNNLHEAILTEKDPTKQAILRRQSVLSDFYLGSVHALAENGEFVIASKTGSQLPHIVFTSPNLIFVVSTKKIVPTLADAMIRLEQYVVPLEDEHMKQKYGARTALNKIIIFKNENSQSGRKIYFILVKENLGF